MTIFRYFAVDEQGRTVSGTVDAVDWKAAEATLVARGLREPRLTDATAAETRSESLGHSDAVELARYLTELAKSGLPLGGGLRAIAQDLPPGRLSRAVERLAAQIDAGQSLPVAFESFGSRLPPHLRELMIAGARSGNLAQTLDQVLWQEGQVDDFGRQLRQAVGYPLILLAFLTVWLWFVTLWLVPVMATLTADFKTELPAITRLLIELARLAPGVILATAVGLLVIAAAGRTTTGAAFVSRLWSKLPWIGPAWWYRGLVEFCGLTAAFLEQGMPLPEALRLTSLASRDAAIRRACGRMADEVASGQSLSTCLARRSLFPPTLASTVAWGENHAALAEACHSARQMFCERLESQTELIRLVLPSMIFLLLGASVLFVVLGFFSGLLKLVTDLS
jgi:type II secretory pathway component PulF